MRRQTRPGQDGMALIMVLLLGLIAAALAVAMLGFTLGSLPLARHSQNWNAAYAAAEAGVDDFLYRLNRDGAYYRYSATTPPPDGNAAFTQFVPVPGGPGGTGSGDLGWFRYRVDQGPSVATGPVIKITVTGRVRAGERTVTALIRRQGFLDYLYLTDKETKDPAAYTSPPDNYNSLQAATSCGRYYYDTPPNAGNCTFIFFRTGDVITGPLHSNDAIRISGDPQYRGSTTTSWTGANGVRWLGSGNPSFQRPGDPAFQSVLGFPPSNAELRAEADPALGGTGCMYTGPTRITLNSTGTMNVVSPLTRNVNPTCGPGNSLPLPVSGVIFVQNVPTLAGDPNFTAACQTSGYYPPGLPVPVAGDRTQYKCSSGDAFVSGTLDGQLTIGADNNIVITNNTTYRDTGASSDDLLGLIANNYVQVFHPVDGNGNNLPGSRNNLTIRAAILALNHSFIVQNYQYGNTLGNLNVIGAISQKFRGPVGTFGQVDHGYLKNYVYDNRLQVLSPPHFLDPVRSAWQVRTLTEVKKPAGW